MFRFKKSIFFKLYRYYIKKLVVNWLIYLALVVALSLLLHEQFRVGENENIWNETWRFCLSTKLPKILYLGVFLISTLVWEALKKEDAVILSITSPINRPNMFLAKIASCFTYLWITNLSLSLPILFLSGGEVGFTWISGLTFLLFDALILPLVIFFWVYTPFFYFYFPAREKNLKFLVFFLYFIFLLGYLILTFKSIEIFRTPWIPIALSLPIGLGFLSFYWNDFRQHDYT